MLLPLLALGATLAAAPHSEPPPPPPVPVINYPTGIEIEPPRWSWLHWWEANREAWIAPLVQKRWTQDRANDDAAAVRDRAAAALAERLDDPHESVRREAAIALGRMKVADARDRLQMMVTADPSLRVRSAAAFALGLLGDDTAQRFLLGQNYPTDGEFVAAICALGLAPQIDDAARRGLISLGPQRAPLPNAALWSLRQHAAGQRGDWARSAVERSENPWVVVEALLTLGRTSDRDGWRLLASVAAMDADARRLPVFRLLDDVADDKREALIQAQVGGRPKVDPVTGAELDPIPLKYRRAHARLMDQEPPSVSIDRSMTAPTPVGIVIGIEAIYAARLRCAAIIALATVEQPGSVTTLWAVLNERRDDDNELARGLAALGLGRLGATDAMGDLVTILEANRAKQGHLKDAIESPVRGFAALGLGIYARPIAGAQGGGDRPGWDQAAQVLAGRVADPREMMEVRCAAAVALGLTGRSEVLPIIADATRHVTDRDLPLAGYAIMARAMLGDAAVATPAQRLLDAGRASDPTTDLLGRRAAVLAVGIAGTREGLPVLASAWNEPWWVNREVILALGLGGATAVADEVIPRLDAASPWERAFMAESLGRLFAAWPDPASRFVVDSAFTMRDRLMGPFRAEAAPFLYDHLVPALGGSWP